MDDGGPVLYSFMGSKITPDSTPERGSMDGNQSVGSPQTEISQQLLHGLP